MNTEKDIKEKWQEVLDYATEHATKKGLHTGVKWLEDSFNEYLELSDNTPGYGMGGQPGSIHNREVLAERVCLELGNHVGGRHLIDESQETKLRQTLNDIVNNERQNRILHR